MGGINVAGLVKGTPMKLLFVLNDAGFFLSHRLELAKAARESGYDVHVTCPEDNKTPLIKEHGFTTHALPLKRSSMNPIKELQTLFALRKIYKKLRPDLIHHLTIKPIIYGSIAARLTKMPCIINAPTGLGFLFTRERWPGKLLGEIGKTLYRAALKHPRAMTIFQNPDDRDLFINNKLLTHEKTILIRSSGVDIQKFVPLAEPGGIPVVAFIGRILWDKGIAEFIAAAKRLKAQGVLARFVLVGGSDQGNRSAVPEAKIKQWVAENIVEWWGFCKEMQEVFEKVHVVCLPSYREGVPKVLLEAAACAKPIVTTDAPGCREAVIDGENGFMVPVKNAPALAAALNKLIGNKDLRIQMGQAGRELVEREFAVEKVVARTLEVYLSCHPAA